MFEIEPCTVELTGGLELVEQRGATVFRGYCRPRGDRTGTVEMPFMVLDEEVAERVAAIAMPGSQMRIESGHSFLLDAPGVDGGLGYGVGLGIELACVFN